MASSATFPATINGSIYPSVPNTQFPETVFPEFNPAKKVVGVALSGGGPRAMSCAMGQMRGLLDSILYNYIGAISCVSGGSWFGTPFSYAAASFSDATLLGTQTPPSQLTVQELQNLNYGNICLPLTTMTDSAITAVLTYQYEWNDVPYNKLWGRMLNAFFLDPLLIGDDQTFFTLNNITLKQLLQQNVNLTPSNFYLLRNNRPFYIAGGTQNYPLGVNGVMRHMEYSAMYAGTPQQCGVINPDGSHYGYGYVDNILFDTLKPQPTGATTANAYLNINPYNGKQEPFLLCDQMGSSSSAPGSDLDYFNQPGWFPQFNYWSPAYTGKESAEFYSFTDGGNLENTGIIPLLRRQYQLIIACVNSELPLVNINQTDSDYVNGIDAQITRLFGRMPVPGPFPTPNTQVFNDNGKFDALNQALHTAKVNGLPLVYQDTYTIFENNYFGVPAYPGNGQVEVVWIYNDMNKEWYNQLPASVQALLKSTAPDDYLLNFPNLCTVGQNYLQTLGVWVLQALYYTPQQINLLANMHYYNIMGDTSAQIFENALKSVGG
ncbi:hypothetical protein A4D02_25025 [Niastella koreensis]|uniref:PNPLA domain-containing protein n=2 Tax=Niastella koreensis TaxID=354356 RepID=G8TR87_NIAKG|nr:hypothetical protein [Niastella koreensis]AEW00009.1 hypothetical protein Niako_3710 [Niastella koreensis GR20-10]OQP51391.1 hypothetical protein A4D02_25025 [Niastella koreensis]